MIKDNGLRYCVIEADTIIELMEFYYINECSWHPISVDVFVRLINTFNPLQESDKLIKSVNEIICNNEKILSIQVISKTLWDIESEDNNG